MPCYCGEAENEKEELHRAKVRIYFDGCAILNTAQRKMAMESHLRLCPMEIDIDLCKLCKILTKEQMEALFLTGSPSLIKWYKNHLFDDYNNNDDIQEKIIALKELDRIK